MSRNTVAIQTETGTLELEVHTAAHTFAQALAESAVFQAFEQAAERLGRDEIAQNAIQAFQDKQQSLQMLLQLNAVSPEDRAELERFLKTQSDLRVRQSRNAVTQSDVDELRALQREVQSNQRIRDYAETQQAAIAYLPAINQEISQLLGVDFASLAGRGCC